MWPFSRRKVQAAKNRMFELVNELCSGKLTKSDGRRIDSRIRQVVVGLIVPIENRQLQTDRAVAALTKDFSSGGVAMVINQPRGPEQAILGFRMGGAMTFFRAENRHMEPIGGGFYQIGFQLFEIVSLRDYPELKSLSL